MADGIELELRVATPVVIAGESLRLSLTVRNGTESPIVIRDQPMPPTAYTLTSIGDPALVIRRSRQEALAIALGDSRVPPFVEEPTPIPPGQTREIDDDPAAYHHEPFPPGDYSIVATCEIDDIPFESNEVRITVERPTVSCLASAFCPMTGSQAQVSDHRSSDDRRWLFLRDTNDERAEIEAFRRIREIPGEGAVQSLAVTVQVARGTHGRWMAALRGGALVAAQAWGASVTAQPPPAAVELEGATLAPVGFQVRARKQAHPRFDFGDGVFLAAGWRDGGAWVRPLLATATGIIPGQALSLGALTPPKRVLLRWGEGDVVHVVWAESTPGVTRILTRPLAMGASGWTGDVQLVYERAAPLVAMELLAFDPRATAGLVHALLGPEGDDPQARDLVYARIPLDARGADRSRAEHHFLPVPHEAIDHFAIAPVDAGHLVTLMSRGPAIWRASARDTSDWGPLYQSASALTDLQVAASPGGYWGALAVDPSIGVLCVPDPLYSRETEG